MKTLSEYDQAELSEDELIQVAGGKVNAGGAGSCLIIVGGPADKRYDAICVTVGTSDI